MDGDLDSVTNSSTRLRIGAIPARQGALARGGESPWALYVPPELGRSSCRYRVDIRLHSARSSRAR